MVAVAMMKTLTAFRLVLPPTLLLLFLFSSKPAVEALDPFSPRTCSYAELVSANVVGRITGGVNIFIIQDKPLCPRRMLNARYRQLDGRCNHPLDYGSTFKPIKRYMKAHYQDKYGRDEPRQYSVTGPLLPSARMISWKIHPDRSSPSPLTLLVMQMGQLVDHDITSAPVPTDQDSSIKCCGIPRGYRFEECFPISVPARDPKFRRCMEFVRSEFATDERGNKIYPREQLNALTSFLDGSAIYGNHEKALRRLRMEQGKGALLRTVRVKGKLRLPKDSRSDCLSRNHPSSYCQLAGDERVNEQPGLSAIHLVFHLEHNNVVYMLVKGILRKRNQQPTFRNVERFIRRQPDSVKEHLFQEAKKILTGIFQKIVYCEWLPLIIGPRLIRKFKLGCQERCVYDPSIDPRIANSFLSAAFRFGHTMIPNTIVTNSSKAHQLKDMFMIPDHALLFHESIVEGLTQSHAQSVDRFVSEAVSRHLFESKNGPSGALDLVALNIQRGRDHGIASYYHWKRHFKLKRFTRVEHFDRKIGRRLLKIYRNVKDIDLFTGGIMEPPVPGGVVGETFGHIIASQFHDLKYGDAFFFLCNREPQGFTDDQLAAIQATSFTKMLCRNSDMEYIQQNPFSEADARNRVIKCRDLLDLDVLPWMLYF